MMITLMLALALMMIALVAALPELKQQIRRDREAELRHRGTAYMRAIQRFYKKLGRYPSSLEELENTNNLRFLRKRYTDPMSRDPATGKEKDFKLLHQADIALNNGPVLPGQNGVGGQGGLPAQSGVEHKRAARMARLPRMAIRVTLLPPATRMHREIRIRPDRRLRIPTQVPIPASRGRRSVEDRFWVLPAQARRRPFACSSARTITTTGSLYTSRGWTAAAS